MKKLAMTPLQSRLLAIFLAILTLAALVAAVAVPTLWLHKRYDRLLDDHSDRLRRYRRVAALRPAIEEAIRATEKRDSHKYYLKGSSPTLAAAELQGLVTRIIDSHRGRIMSSQIAPPKDDAKTSGPLKVTMSVQLGAAIIPLQIILHGLETAEPYLFIDQLTIRATQGRQYKPVPGVQPEYLVQMTLHAYAPAAGGRP